MRSASQYSQMMNSFALRVRSDAVSSMYTGSYYSEGAMQRCDKPCARVQVCHADVRAAKPGVCARRGGAPV